MILDNLMSASPLLLFAAIYQIASQRRLSKSEISAPPLHIVGIYLFCLLLGIILNITGTVNLTDIYILGGRIDFSSTNIVPFVGVDTFGFNANAIMFIPFGILLPLIFSEYRNFGKTLLAGFLFSLTIELSQLFNHRATDIDDLIMNTLGTAIGFAIFALANLALRKQTERFTLPKNALRHEAFIYMLIVFAANFFINPLLIFIYYGYVLI